MGDIDSALAAGPIVLELGASWCDWCQKEKPVMRSLAGQYPNVAFLDADIDQSGALKDAFYVSAVPQLEVIARKKLLFRSDPVTRCTSRPCRSATFESHGISEPFSTGSQPQ